MLRPGTVVRVDAWYEPEPFGDFRTDDDLYIVRETPDDRIPTPETVAYIEGANGELDNLYKEDTWVELHFTIEEFPF